MACDVSREDEIANAVNQVMARFGRLDVVVNNAGTMLFKPIRDFSAAEWRNCWT